MTASLSIRPWSVVGMYPPLSSAIIAMKFSRTVHLIAVCLVAIQASGCADRSKIQYKSVAELYQEAVESTRRSEAATAVQVELNDASRPFAESIAQKSAASSSESSTEPSKKVAAQFASTTTTKNPSDQATLSGSTPGNTAPGNTTPPSPSTASGPTPAIPAQPTANQPLPPMTSMPMLIPNQNSRSNTITQTNTSQAIPPLPLVPLPTTPEEKQAAKKARQAARQAAKQAARLEVLKSNLPPDIPVVSSSWNFDQQAPLSTVVAAPELLPGLPNSNVNLANPLINEIFEQTDIREAIDIIASASGGTVVVDESIGGVVTLQIKDATFEQALEMLLLPLGLVYVQHEGTYLVSPPDPESPLFNMISTRMQYAPRNHPPTKLAALVPKRLAQFFQISDDRNLIVIEAPQKIGEDLMNRLQELDQPVEQVVLEAIVCVSSPNSGFRFGFDWNHTLQLNNIDQVKVGLSGLAFNGAASKYGVNNAFDDFAVTSAFVQSLAENGYVTIRAAPRVTAKDGEKASIAIERETFFSLQPTNANLLFRQDVQKVDAGINLMITPRIRGDMISVEIERAEVSEDIRTNSASSTQSTNSFPTINRRIVSTKVDVHDGRTIVIGGLVQRQTVDRVSKIPFLGSIPGIGGLFRTVEQQEQDVEVAIFISPRIVRDNYCVDQK